MQVTSVRIQTVGDPDNERIRAFASIELDNSFVVKDIKVIQPAVGDLIVTMPSRSISDHCNHCYGRNPIIAKYCMYCGTRQPDNRARMREDGRYILYYDVAHPINQATRDLITKAVLEQFRLDTSEHVDSYTKLVDELDKGA